MLSEEIFSSICGPPIAANTAVSKDVGIYGHSLSPSWAVKATFKKSSTSSHCLAVNETHIFAAQDQKAQVHVYSRLRGNQEALVAFPERIRSLALVNDVLILGTSEGRLILWEVSRLVLFLFSLDLTTLHPGTLCVPSLQILT
jgi:pre-rRNA-processing protein IPI3